MVVLLPVAMLTLSNSVCVWPPIVWCLRQNHGPGLLHKFAIVLKVFTKHEIPIIQTNIAAGRNNQPLRKYRYTNGLRKEQ